MISDNYVPTKDLGNDITVAFTYSFPILAEANHRLFSEVITTGVQTLQVNGVDYTLVFDENGGTATFGTPPITGVSIINAREIPQTQQVNYTTSNGFQGNVVENSFDKVTALVQDTQENVDRSVKLPLASTVDPELPLATADAFIGYNATATGFENKTIGSSTDTLPTIGAPADINKIVEINDAATGYQYTGFATAFTRPTSLTAGGILKLKKGADVASTASMTLGDDGNYFDITGTTGITSITIKTAGTEVTMQFDGILTVTDGGNLKINDDFITAAESTLTLRSDGTDWFEVSRSPVSSLSLTSPAFLVRPASDQENIATGSAIDIIFGTEIFDQAGDFASNIFTAPVTGKYLFEVGILLKDIDTASTQITIRIVTSNRNYDNIIDPATLLTADTSFFSFPISVLADMDASDTAKVTISITGGAAQTDIAAASTHFSGALLIS